MKERFDERSGEFKPAKGKVRTKGMKDEKLVIGISEISLDIVSVIQKLDRYVQERQEGDAGLYSCRACLREALRYSAGFYFELKDKE